MSHSLPRYTIGCASNEYGTHWNLEPDSDGSLCRFSDAESIIATLRAELEALKAAQAGAEEARDAQRYRWLRTQIQDGPLTIAESDSWALQPWSGDDPDRKIDAAITATRSATQGEAG